MPSAKDREDMLKDQDVIDVEIFEQLVDLGEDDEGFLEDIIQDWINQAKDKFEDMDKLLKEESLLELSRAAHSLKGSSSQLGAQKLKDSCGRLQHYGELWDEDKDELKTKNMTEEEAIKRIKPLLVTAKTEYAEARHWMKTYLGITESDDGSEPDIPKPVDKAEEKAKSVSAPSKIQVTA
ncbi:hypothetical protein FRC14_007987 [Serendipita sp. 396]|nr:hypothetical protein FRC14_007987 [Serendipita sp. 396]KAG8768718.1 hypothetical protein FRC16_006936 [Serendipita sp. 398]KAG8786901.1 hypothetical protein FRC15_010479 [Serendipita sp. 397]KAG8823838.1 hypothetical protein FRC19_003026 [Serendipita sp. 401]KAG8833753.1 hypothetical protein FRC18_003092 [Serendipita sp. 400]KAG8858133.1 hypothetical protein FRC20_012061 [Serendipita sp. 405]KAG9057722.1 hypothetical protein FS842_004378 [Serendipita sp. 407]